MKKRNFKNNLKYILIGIGGVLPLTAIPFLGLFPHHNNALVNTVNTKALNTDISVSPYNDDLAATAKPEFQNAIYQDAFEKATYDPDSILVYSIYWFGVFHRFGLVSHILSVLEINPNQKIYVMETSKKNDYSPLLASNPDGTRKYPNVKIVESAPGFDSTDGVWLLSNRFITPIDFFKDIYKENPDAKIHGYFADFTILEVMKNFFNGSNLPILKKNIHDYWGMFNKFDSLSIFADGTGSVDFFNTTFYDYLLKAGIGEYTEMASNTPGTTKFEYKEAANFRKQFLESQNKGEDFAHKFLEKNNAIMYVASLITTKDFNNDNVYPMKDASGNPVQYKDSKFFLPTTEFIRDVNRTGSTFLKTSNNEFFNPYNSYEADLIESFKKLPIDKFEELTKILKAKDVFEDKDLEFQMENKINVVYSGTLLNNSTVSPSAEKATRKSEIDNLRAIKILVERDNPGKKVQIIYKGHPRDYTIAAIQGAFKQIIDEYKLTDVPEILVVDPTIPYELYLFSGLFDPNPTTGKEVKLYSTYSTIIWFLFAAGRGDDIIKIAISENTFTNSKYIENIYGLNSRIFNTVGGPGGNDKITTTEKLLAEAGIK